MLWKAWRYMKMCLQHRRSWKLPISSLKFVRLAEMENFQVSFFLFFFCFRSFLVECVYKSLKFSVYFHWCCLVFLDLFFWLLLLVSPNMWYVSKRNKISLVSHDWCFKIPKMLLRIAANCGPSSGFHYLFYQWWWFCLIYFRANWLRDLQVLAIITCALYYRNRKNLRRWNLCN